MRNVSKPGGKEVAAAAEDVILLIAENGNIQFSFFILSIHPAQ